MLLGKATIIEISQEIFCCNFLGISLSFVIIALN